MINKIANGIADFVCDKKMHEKNDYERAILVYGYEIILSSALSFAAVIVLGLAFCKLFEAIIFFLTFFIHPKIKIMIARFPRFVIINSKYNNNYFDLAKGIPIENFSN